MRTGTPTHVDVFQVIADANRREMLHLLSKESLSINAMAAHFDMSRPAVSKHLKLLEEGGFITIVEMGRERHCSLHQQGFIDLQEWVEHFDHFWAGRLKKLERLVHKQVAGKKKNKRSKYT